MSRTEQEAARGHAVHESRVDVIVVGAGFSGLYMLHRLRQQGLTVSVLEAAPDVGGTWYWNAYPGARCDVESMDYSYSFSPELDQEWEWTEKYASQPEILSYLQHVAERFDLRKDIRFDTRVTTAEFDEDASRWRITAEGGERFEAQFCIFATGGLSDPLAPPFPGLDRYQGEWYTTGQWPHEPVDFKGKRVAIIGTGSSTVQSGPIIAEEAEHLTVFQRTPSFSVPGYNGPLPPEEQAERKADYPRVREIVRGSALGMHLNISDKSALDLGPEERQAELETRWRLGGTPRFMMSFVDLLVNQESNDVAADFLRDKIREVVDDPEVAELLCPDYAVGTKRLCTDNGYFEMFNRSNVSLVSVRDNPIAEITPTGVRLEDGSEYEADLIVFAVGFDAMTGTLLRIDIRGRAGRSLRDEWRDGPQTYLGLGVAGFPNLFTISGPASPSLLTVMVVSIEQHVEWITECIGYMREHGFDAIEPTPDAQDEWMDHHIEVGDATLFPRTESYYVGANVPGKPRVLTVYLGGLGVYRERCSEIAANDYEGFTLSSGHDRSGAGVGA
jgi:cation diffusion facilitator CzcD-associated flavoprotein CzcO